LESDLKFIQQAVIHVRQTKLQLKLNRAYKNFATRNGITNFLQRYQEMFPVNNHPGCLLVRSLSRQQSRDDKSKKHSTETRRIVKTENISSDQSNHDVIYLLDSDEEEDDDVFASKLKALVPAQSDITPSEKEWWRKVLSKHPNMSDVENGGKIVLLLQILVHADIIGDKVLVFSQCLKTLDFIEQVLQMNDWALHLPSIANLNPEKRYGNWRKNIDYLRIDGHVEAKKRGDLVNKFNYDKNRKNVEETAKLFLISSNAGNVGINLVGANRVILFDSSWNPSKDQQSLHRSYRYGQKKPVYVYRLLTEGTKYFLFFY
jgi:transcriptional regulator ATRX